MAGKADFTEEEWEQLRKGATGAGMLVSVSDRSFFDTFKEASSLAKYLKGSRDDDSQLLRDLASEGGTRLRHGRLARRGRERDDRGAARRGCHAAAKAPDELEGYRAFVLELAESVGKAAGGGDQVEAATVEKIRAALG